MTAHRLLTTLRDGVVSPPSLTLRRHLALARARTAARLGPKDSSPVHIRPAGSQ